MFFRKREGKGLAESEKALREADKTLKDIRSRDEEVHEVAESLRVMREKNHFAERLGEIFFADVPQHNLGGGHAK